MNRREPIIFQTLGLLIAACSCIAAWLVFYPEVRDALPPSGPMPPIISSPTPTPTPTPVRLSQILVNVYYDDDNNGRFGVTNDGEHYSPDFLIGQAVVELYAGSSCSGAVLATAGDFLAYFFNGLEAGTYCVKVVNDSVTNPGGCALVPGKYGNTKVYTLLMDETMEDYDAGFPYICQ